MIGDLFLFIHGVEIQKNVMCWVFFEPGRCANWFGNNLDWSTFPFERADQTRGFTPDGCTEELLQPYGDLYQGLYCGVFRENAEGVWYYSQSCNGSECQNGCCVNDENCNSGRKYFIFIVFRRIFFLDTLIFNNKSISYISTSESKSFFYNILILPHLDTW